MLRAERAIGHRDYEVSRELRAAITAGDLRRVTAALDFGKDHLGSNKALAELLKSDDARFIMHGAAKAGQADIGTHARTRTHACSLARSLALTQARTHAHTPIHAFTHPPIYPHTYSERTLDCGSTGGFSGRGGFHSTPPRSLAGTGLHSTTQSGRYSLM